jgi:hypothetical protein
MRKILYTFAILFTISINSFSQAPNWKWAKKNGTYSAAFSNSMCIDKNGNQYIIGIQSSLITIGDSMISGNGGYDIFLSKYNSQGVLICVKNIGGNLEDRGYSICIDKYNDLYITGSYKSDSLVLNDTCVLRKHLNPEYASSDMFIAKLDTLFQLKWAWSIGGDSDDVGASIASDNNGDIYIAGNFRSDTLFINNQIIHNSGAQDVLVAKFNRYGDLIWAYGESCNQTAWANSISCDKNNNIILTGGFSHNSFLGVGSTHQSSDGTSFFVAKFNGNFDFMWAKGVNQFTNGSANGNHVVADSHGNIYATGYFKSSSVSFGNYNLNNSYPSLTDIFIVKYDSSGILKWAQKAGFTSWDYGYSLFIDKNDDIYSAGDADGNKILCNSDTIVDRFFGGYIIKYGPLGNVLWAKGTPASIKNIVLDTAGFVYISGNNNNENTIFGNDTIFSNRYHLYVAKLDSSCSSLNYPGGITVTGDTNLCQPIGSNTYTCTSTPNATSYLWQLFPGFAGTISGTGQTGTVTWNSSFTGTAEISVRGRNGLGYGPISVISIKVKAIPANAGVITGSSGITYACQKWNMTYTVPVIIGATSYNWELPFGASGTAIGAGNSINVYYSNSAVSGNITVRGVNFCGMGTSSTFPVTVRPLPTKPDTIAGLTTVCGGQQAVSYSVYGVNNAISYYWSLPSGNFANGTSTSNSIIYNYYNYPTPNPGFVMVKGENACGFGESYSLPIAINPKPATASSISGLSIVCRGHSSVIYTVPPIDNATSYAWTLPAGASGSSTTNTITVDFGIAAITGYISVKGINACGEGIPASKAISVNPLPATASSISGLTEVCKGQSTVQYSIPPIDYASSYAWTIPVGASGTSSTNMITVDFGTDAISGNISVKGINACGEGNPASKAISVNPLPASASIISGLTEVCQGQTAVQYSIPPIDYASSYAWTIPVGASGSSNTNTIAVDFGTAAISDNIYVKGINACGEGIPASKTISVNPLPVSASTISGLTEVCQGQSTVEYSVPPIENAITYTWTLPSGATGSSTTNTITIDYGTTAITSNISVKGDNACGEGISKTMNISVNSIPLIENSIIGLTEVFQNQSDVYYSIPAISNATSYIWTLPEGATGTSTTNTISVNYGSSAVSGYITVRGANVCGEGLPASLLITVDSLPDNAGSISGLSTVHQTESGVVYTVPEIANATSYIWTLPNGASNSKSTNSITVNFGDNAESGEITVKGHNAHGDGVVSTLPVIVIPTPTAPVITLNGLILNSNVSDGNQWYNQNGLINGAIEQSYLATTNGVYYAKAFVDGWSSAPSNNIEISTVNIENQEDNLSVRIYPNPINDELIIESTNETEAITFEIINSIGQTVYNGNVKNKTRVKTDFFSPGLYVVKIKNGNAIFLTKIVKE